MSDIQKKITVKFPSECAELIIMNYLTNDESMSMCKHVQECGWNIMLFGMLYRGHLSLASYRLRLFPKHQVVR